MLGGIYIATRKTASWKFKNSTMRSLADTTPEAPHRAAQTDKARKKNKEGGGAPVSRRFGLKNKTSLYVNKKYYDSRLVEGGASVERAICCPCSANYLRSLSLSPPKDVARPSGNGACALGWPGPWRECLALSRPIRQAARARTGGIPSKPVTMS